MKQIAGDEYSGNWNANVPAGVYSVTLVASASDMSNTFKDALEIRIIGSDSDNTR